VIFVHEVINVTPLVDYRLLVEFENGEKRVGDINPLIERGGVFTDLKDIRVFGNVYIEYGAVTWKDKSGNEVDICPDKLYMDSVPYTENSAL
jgi:hypothetical protein